MKRILGAWLILAVVCSSALGQEREVRRAGGPRRQLATIIFSGLGGAVIGLSTLSFYGRPQEHLANIAVGFAVGVITGTIYVTYKSATSREYYEDPSNESRREGAPFPRPGRLPALDGDAPPSLASAGEGRGWALIPRVYLPPAVDIRPVTAAAPGLGAALVLNY